MDQSQRQLEMQTDLKRLNKARAKKAKKASGQTVGAKIKAKVTKAPVPTAKRLPPKKRGM